MNYILLISMLFAAGILSSAENILFEENFRRFNLGKDSGLTGKDEIMEENGIRFQRANRYSWMFGDMNYFKANRWTDYTLTFDFRFGNPKNMGAVLILKYSGGKRENDIRYHYLNLGFGNTMAHIDYNGFPKKDFNRGMKYKAIGMPDLKPGVWYRMTLDLAYRHLVLKLTDPAVKQTWTLFDCETLPGGGSPNLCAYGVPFDLTNLKITTRQ